MKIRMDFVTNSSSSCYVTFHITNKVLASLWFEAGLVRDVYGDTVKGRFGQELRTALDVPNGGSISEWLLKSIEKNDEVYFKEDEYEELKTLIAEHKSEIDSSTVRATFDLVRVDTESEGSFYSFEERKSGKIYSTSFSEYDWDSEKEGCQIYDYIVGDEEDNRKKAKELCGLYVSDDPWYKEKDLTDIFDDSSDFSFKGHVVCLSGDFNYGKKAEVTAFIEQQGGKCSSSVNNSTSVVLVGGKGSESWKYGNYGTKVEKALGIRRAGGQIIILKEDSSLFEK